MKLPSLDQAVHLVVKALSDFAGSGPGRVCEQPGPAGPGADAVVKAGPFTFAVTWVASGGPARAAARADRIRREAHAMGRKVIPLVAAPYLSDAARRRCEEVGVGWLDLSGNAGITAPGLRILIEGRENRYKRRGRPSSVFAPKSSRITRWLLMHPSESATQRTIARASGLDEGFTSRIVARLEDDGLVVREGGGTIRVRDPGLLLDAWVDAYDISKHRILRGHLPARTGHELCGRLSDGLLAESEGHAMTGMAAAWLYTRFAAYRLAAVYLEKEPGGELLDRLSIREEEEGANVWLVVPNDSGVFEGAEVREGVRCVHPIQAYLDLKGHPGRAAEAAGKLRERVLNWGRND